MKTIELASWDQAIGQAPHCAPQRHYWPIGSALLLASIPVATFDLVERNTFEVSLHLFLVAVAISVALHIVHAAYHWSQNRASSWPLVSIALALLPLTYLLLDADPSGYGVSDRFVGREETVFSVHTRHYLFGCSLIQVVVFLLFSAHQRGALSGVGPFVDFVLSTTHGEWVDIHPADPMYRVYGPMMWVEKPWSLPAQSSSPVEPKVLTFTPAHTLKVASALARPIKWALSIAAIGMIAVAILNYWYTYPLQVFTDDWGSLSSHAVVFSMITVMAGVVLIISSAIVRDAR